MQSNHSKPTSSGLPKIIFDAAKQQSNVNEVGRKLNFYVQQNFTGLNDCISTRTLDPIAEPPEPTAPQAVQVAPAASALRSRRGATSEPNEASSSSSSDSNAASVPQTSVETVSSLEHARYLERYKIYLVENQTRRVELRQLFGVIDELLSITSKERVIAHADYAASLAARDGCALWKIVYATHQSVNMYHTASQQTEALNVEELLQPSPTVQHDTRHLFRKIQRMPQSSRGSKNHTTFKV
jgi:hypothetical protein